MLGCTLRTTAMSAALKITITGDAAGIRAAVIVNEAANTKQLQQEKHRRKNADLQNVVPYMQLSIWICSHYSSLGSC